MITAEDANKQANIKVKTSKDLTLDGYLMLVEGAIKSAVNKGEFSVSINTFGWNHEAVEEIKGILGRLGYIVYYGGAISIEVSWHGVDQ